MATSTRNLLAYLARTRFQIGSFGIIAITVVLVWALPAFPDFAHLRLSNPGDSESFAYYLS